MLTVNVAAMLMLSDAPLGHGDGAAGGTLEDIRHGQPQLLFQKDPDKAADHHRNTEASLDSVMPELSENGSSDAIRYVEFVRKFCIAVERGWRPGPAGYPDTRLSATRLHSSCLSVPEPIWSPGVGLQIQAGGRRPRARI